MDPLSKIFSSSSRVKIMRLFLFNPEESYDSEDVSKKTNAAKKTVASELKKLHSAGLLKKKSFTKTIEKKLKTKTKKVKKKTSGFVLNQNFKYLLPLQNLLIKGEPLSHSGIEKRFKKSGNLKLLLVSGVFISDPESRVDIMVVGDKLNMKSIDSAIRSLETDIGTELRYATFETKDFQYRMNIYDKLIRDVLENPHEIIIEKIKI